MRNKPLRGLCKKSPIKTNTELADRTFTRGKVNEALILKGEHTEGNLRGTMNTSTGNLNAGVNNAMIDPTI